MNKDSYLVVEEKALPEIYQKVVQANDLLKSGRAGSTSEAVRMAGISRSVYYKYRDAVFPYTRQGATGILTVQALLSDRPGVLVGFLTEFYESGANILTVNQNIPVKGRAYVTVSARVDQMEPPGVEQLLLNLRQVEGVVRLDSMLDQ